MERQEIELRLKEAQERLNLLKFHKETLEALMRNEEKKFVGITKDREGKSIVPPVTAASVDALKARAEYFYFANDLVNTIGEIRAKENLIANYMEHLQTTLKEETKAFSDKEILDAIIQMLNLPIKGKDKQQAEGLADDFRSGKVVGLAARYEYYEAVKNFIESYK